MNESDLLTQEEAARAYESLFVPALFGPWAPRVADAARIGTDQRVLDVACGTGVLAREALSRTGPGGRVVGLDPAPGMLGVAREVAPEIEWREGVAESLPFPDASFDVVTSQFGLMFFTDVRRALAEMVRVLTPGGRLAVAVWDSLETMPAYSAEVDLLERTVGQRAADAIRAPFVLGDRSALAELLAGSGAKSVDIVTRGGTAEFPSLRAMIEADLRGWLPAMGVVLAEDEMERVLVGAAETLASHVTTDGAIRFEVKAHIVSAKRDREVSTSW